jgi:hypothetical protein
MMKEYKRKMNHRRMIYCIGFSDLKKMIGIGLVLCSMQVSAQITEKEEFLKSISEDTIEGWKYHGQLGLDISQVGLTNWAAGGQSSLAVAGKVNLTADWKGGPNTWANMLDLNYGVLRQGQGVSFNIDELIKTQDKIEFNSKYGRKASDRWYYAGLLNFLTQATPGYDPVDSTKISDFMAPAYLLGAIGMDYKYKGFLNVFISPVTIKMTFVSSNSLANDGEYGVTPAERDEAGNVITPGRHFRAEYGGYVRVEFQKTWKENITLTSKLSLFSNYANNPQNIDVNWETLLELKVNRFISANILTHLIYDDDIDISLPDGGSGPRVQFKEVIGVGFAYKF